MGKHIPLRMCIGCRKMKPTGELLRIARDFNTDEVKMDTDKRVFGRGAYICRNEECIKLAMKKKALEKVFKRSMQEMYNEALSEINMLGEVE